MDEEISFRGIRFLYSGNKEWFCDILIGFIRETKCSVETPGFNIYSWIIRLIPHDLIHIMRFPQSHVISHWWLVNLQVPAIRIRLLSPIIKSWSSRVQTNKFLSILPLIPSEGQSTRGAQSQVDKVSVQNQQPAGGGGGAVTGQTGSKRFDSQVSNGAKQNLLFAQQLRLSINDLIWFIDYANWH